MRSYPFRYDEAADQWVLQTPLAVPNRCVVAARQFTLKVQTDRLASLPAGEKRDRVKTSLDALRAGRCTQMVVAPGVGLVDVKPDNAPLISIP
jgi:hypothetical protein